MESRETQRYISCAADYGFDEASARALLQSAGGSAAMDSLESFLQLLLAAECPENAMTRSLYWETVRIGMDRKEGGGEGEVVVMMMMMMMMMMIRWSITPLRWKHAAPSLMLAT